MRILRRLCLLLLGLRSGNALSSPAARWTDDLRRGYARRVAADPAFAKKSALEVLLAASTQLSAEWTQRGTARLVPELDFVVAGVLTAVIGKYYSMWRVAKTQEGPRVLASPQAQREATVWGLPVPTNAFQETMLDGTTRPKSVQRVGSFIAPIPSLFRAGVLASTLGYGLTAVAIALRAVLAPSFVAATRQVNIVYAALYTGVFMAIVSNVRYQLLQGLVEPYLERLLRRAPALQNIALFATRVANGWLGSVLAIAGMKGLGLQKLK